MYNIDNISSVPDVNIQFIISDELFLDALLMEIKGKTISYSTYIKIKTLERENMLEKDFSNLEQNLIQDSSQKLEDKHDYLDEIRIIKLKGHCIRSKATQYSANLESRNYINEQILVFKKENESLIRNQQEILGET